MQTRIHRLHVLSLALVVSLALASCGGVRAVVTPNPTPAQVQSVRQLMEKALINTDTVVSMAQTAGRTIAQLPISTAAKNSYDCPLVKTFGMTAVPASVVSACGPVPVTSASPFQRALDTLKTATTCPGLGAASKALLDVLDPLIRKYETAPEREIALLASSFHASLLFVSSLSGGGLPCSD